MAARFAAVLQQGGARSAARECQRGLSLIELLVLLVIIGVVTGALVFTVGGTAAQQLETDARRSQRLIQLACEQAGLTGRDVGIRVGDEALEFGYFIRGAWRPVPDAPGEPLRRREIGAGVQVQLERDGELLDPAAAAPDAPQLACHSSGEMTPFQLTLTRPDLVEGWLLVGALDGAIELEPRLEGQP